MRESEQCILAVILDGAERIANSTIPGLVRVQQARLLFFERMLEGIPVSILLNKNAVERVP